MIFSILHNSLLHNLYFTPLTNQQALRATTEIMNDRCVSGIVTTTISKSAQRWPTRRADLRASSLRGLHLPYDEGRQKGGGQRRKHSERSSGWGGKGQRGVWNPRERCGGRGSAMMWLASILGENKSSLCSTTVITEQTGRKWAACSPETSTR